MAGYIGKIRLKIPVYRIRSEAWSICIEDLYLVAHPITDFTYNEEVEKKIMQDYKMNLLDSLELKFQSQYESMNEANYYQSSYLSWLSASTSFVTNIVENLQLEIKSVHIRYENLSASPKAQFACGLMIKNLSIKSTDDQWNSKFVYRDPTSDMRKLVDLDNFNIYWEDNANFFGDYDTAKFVAEMRDMVKNSFTEEDARLQDDHNYILKIEKGKAKMKKNCSEKPLRSSNEPRLTFELELERFPLSLNSIQYRQLMDLIEISSRNNRIWMHRKYRPSSSIKEKPSDWWRYAINVHLIVYRTRRERLKWEFMLKRARDLKEYFNAYYNYLLHPESLNSATKLVKERIEYDLSFDELCCLRELVYDKIKRNKEEVKIESKNKEASNWYQSWFSGWYGERAGDPNETGLSSNASASTQMKRDLSESFDIETEIQQSVFELDEEFVNVFDTIENDTFLKRDAVFAQVNLVIQNASFTLCSSFSDLKQNSSQANQDLALFSKQKSKDLPKVLEIEFRSVEIGVEAKPRYCLHEFKIKLGELYVKDTLSEEAVSSNRPYLMSSEFGELLDLPPAPPPSTQMKVDFLSTSCPSIPTEFSLNNLENYASLPSKLHNQSIFQMLPRRKKKNSKIQPPNPDLKKALFESESCPSTPIATHKSGLLDRKEDLVNITLMFVDKSSPLFEKKFNGINRFVNIEFNRLETNVLLDTWSVIMNFFSSAAEHSVLVESLDLKEKSEALDEALGKDWSNSKIDITVNELSLVLYKSESEQLAKIGISNFSCFSTTKNGNTTAEGRGGLMLILLLFLKLTIFIRSNLGSLGKVTVIDLTLSGKVYKERFITAGKEALSFNFFKHGGKNLEFKTEYDMKLDLQMSLVQYVHSQRFFMELLNFWHLYNSMDPLNGAGNLTNSNKDKQPQYQLPTSPKKPRRGSRLALNINADAPVIILPISSLCDHVLVADFGKLEVQNRFAYAGSQNTISTVCKKSGLVHSDLTRNFKKLTGVVTRTMTSDILNKLTVVKSPILCLLDVINLSLTEMDLYKGVLVGVNEEESAAAGKAKKSKDILNFPSFKIKRLPGKILKERFKLKLQLERNLDGEFSRSVPDISMKGTFSTVHCTLNPSTYQLIRGIIEHNLGEPINHLKQIRPMIVGREGLNAVLLVSTHIWTSMATHLELKNVTVEIVNGNHNEDDDLAQAQQTEQKLARIDFVSSNLSIESFTDSSKDIDLVSQEIRVIDTRYEHLEKSNQPNIFINILQPKSKSRSKDKNPLQIEIHYRSKPDLACLTVLLNNMRIMAIFDWFKAMSDFLMQTFNFQTMATFNSEVASHFQQLLEYQSLHCPCFELRVNVMDTEFVVVEDSSTDHTHAVILRGTSVLNLTTDDNDGEPFNCSLERLEVFSCMIGNEQEQTSLSIVDPLNITVSLTSKAIHSSFRQRDDIKSEHVLIIDIMSINTRLSFNDITLILKILNSLPKQTESFTIRHSKQANNLNLSKISTTSADLDDSIFALPSHVNQLQSLGFDRHDCGLALEACQGNINDAAIWLAQNSKILSRLDSPDYDQQAFQFVRVGRFHKLFTKYLNIQIQNGNFTLIDDCKDTDVPLFEVKLGQLNSLAIFDRKQLTIDCNYTLTCDYYNRSLSGWEPFIEPWQNKVQFKLQKEPSRKIVISFDSSKTLNFVITNTFLKLYQSVYQTWSDEYERLRNEGQNKTLKKRSPFIPFAIRNETGCVLNFSLLAYTENSRTHKHIIGTSIDKIKTNKTITYGGLELDVIEVDPGKTVPFSFEAPTKIRHQDSHLPRSHKIVVQVDGWYEMFPVSVDKVGVYFREAKPKDIRLETSRIVFDIVLEPNAVKLITVRSALIVHNQLDTPIELSFNTFAKNVLYVNHGSSIPVPLKLVRSMIYVRPCNIGVDTCRSFVEWEHIKKQGESNSQLFHCPPLKPNGNHEEKPKPAHSYSQPYYFCVHTIRDHFPLDNSQNSVGMVTTRTLPGHNIYVVAPLEIVNLLPLELRYCLQNLPFGGIVRPGESSLQYINTQADFTINFLMDNFTKSNSLLIKPGASKDFFMHLEMYDKMGKLLLLQAQICLVTNNALGLKILISAPYWFVNKTGLPLVFKQEGTDQEASGQFEEHEMARCILPLLFSFYDADASLTCIMRLGRGLGKSKWSVGFYLEKGIRVRRVRIASDDPRKPDKVYEIGIEVQNGRGRYKDTKVVTLSPRYQVENLSSFKLQIAQRCTINNQTQAVPDHLDSRITVPSNSNMPFHWPRTDQDKLLCVKISSSAEQFHWSGGFEVIPNSSFHLNVRDINGKCNFLRVEILQTGSTIFIVFSNAYNLPPPIRIDNYSEVQIEFYQAGTLSLWNKSVVRPKSSFNYAWDECTMKPHITVCAPGGSSSTYDLETLRPGNNLTYENLAYICFTGTFLAVDAAELTVDQNENIHNMQLVLEVCEGSNTVILNKKQFGRRSQLWRMDSSHRLLHEGSSPPSEQGRKSLPGNSSINENAMVLDIASPFCKPGEYTALMLRKINPKRSPTQTWNFTRDGRLKCECDEMYVQPMSGFLGLKKGNIAVLGPSQPVSYLKLDNGIQFEQGICTQKMRKGSGMLTVQVLSDGATRVLQVLDVRNMPPHGSSLSVSANRDDLFQLKRYSLPNTPRKGSKDLANHENPSSKLAAAVQKTTQEYKLLINTSGIGVSIVNPLNEELIYVYLENVIVDYCNKINEHFFNCSIKYIQTDNQLIDAEKSIVFYTMDLEESNPNAHLPAIRISAHKLNSPNLEAHFFEQVQIKIKDVILNIEEQLLLKLYDFFSYGQVEKELELIRGETETKNMHIGMTSSLNQASRIYFSLLEIELNKVRLSVFTSSHFSNDLLEIKKRTGLRLMRFEDAKISLESFRKTYSLETFSFLMDAIVNHYRKELKSQAAKILGSVDFLGNPLGFMNDVTDGITELIDGNIGGLFVNISHGISDSTAKFTSVLSDSLGAVTLDSRHQEIRKRIKQESSNGPIKAGFIGLGIGLLGGLTSIVTQTYEGAVQQVSEAVKSCCPIDTN